MLDMLSVVHNGATSLFCSSGDGQYEGCYSSSLQAADPCHSKTDSQSPILLDHLLPEPTCLWYCTGMSFYPHTVLCKGLKCLNLFSIYLCTNCVFKKVADLL